MRQDNLELPPPPGGDRPADLWMETPPHANGTGTDGSAAPRQLTWTGIRRRVTWLTLGVVAVAALVSLLWVPGTTVFKPGELANPHAQILSGTVMKDRCAACHPASSLSPMDLVLGHSQNGNTLTQSDLCLNCHRNRIADNLALAAHNLPLSVRDRLTQVALTGASNADDLGHPAKTSHAWTPAARIDQNRLECSTCHREHHGAENDLTKLTNDQCQSCHSNRFGSFAVSHPEWDRWPYGRGGQIRFDHATHMRKHFPDWKGGAESFDCQSCHPTRTGNRDDAFIQPGEIVRATGYQESCGRCHDDSMNTQIAPGLDLIALPMIPRSVLGDQSEWPESATGFLDGRIPEWTELLLRHNETLATPLRLVNGANLDTLNLADERDETFLRTLATALRELLAEFATQGQQAHAQRLSELGISATPIRRVIRTLPPQLLGNAYQRWFHSAPAVRRPESAQHASPSFIRLVAGQDGSLLFDSPRSQDDPLLQTLSNDASGLDPLLEDPLLTAPTPLDDPLAGPADSFTTPTTAAAAAPEMLLPYGGWYIDSTRMSVRYRAQGHADPVLTASIEIFAQLGDGDPVKKRFFEATVIDACIRCHPGAQEVPAEWNAAPTVGRASEFTRFSHRPHLSVSALGECSHCHRVADSDAAQASHVDFQPLNRDNCAGCHTAAAAGDDCTQCHRYHIGR